MNKGWEMSSSDDDDDQTLLPPSQSGKKFSSPSHIQTKELQVEKLKQTFETSKSKKRFLPYSFEKSEKKHDSNDVKSYASSYCRIKNQDPVEVWKSAAPNYLFLTTCSGISNKYNYRNEGDSSLLPSLGIQDILSLKFGSLLQSAQFNFCIDIEWLMKQYPYNVRKKPLLIVHGERGDSNVNLQSVASQFENIRLCRVDLPPYGTHHTKMMLLRYDNGFRVVISTANLVAQDWNKKSQGFYMSPLFSNVSELSDTVQNHFQSDLINYLSSYNKKELKQWIEIIEKSNMSSAGSIRLVASVPGRHSGPSLSKWGHMKLRNLLQKRAKHVNANWPVIAQFSSIGSLGTDKDKWLCNEWLTSMSSCDLGSNILASSTKPSLKLIFPTVENVRCSLEGYPAGSSLPYSYKNASKQRWLLPMMHEWRADHVGRTCASPHIKSYTRISPGAVNLKAAWFLLTSANLSKAAWGALEKKGTQLSIRSYELGVLFLPSCLDSQHETNAGKQVEEVDCFFSVQSDHDSNRFSFPFSLPLTPYASSDSPWTWDSPHVDAPDRYGNIWNPL